MSISGRACNNRYATIAWKIEHVAALMKFSIKRVYNLRPHVSYKFILPDFTQKLKTYVFFVSILWVAPKKSRLCV